MIESFEGLRTKAYLDSVGIPTIGVGHTLNVKMGDTCTPAQADQWLEEDLQAAEHCVSKLVTVPLLQNEFDALVSFTFNVGCGNLKLSTLLKLLNSGEDKSFPANQFLVWVKAGGKISQGLDARRAKERNVFLNGYPGGV